MEIKPENNKTENDYSSGKELKSSKSNFVIISAISLGFILTPLMFTFYNNKINAKTKVETKREIHKPRKNLGRHISTEELLEEN
jgi:hypothetical protein